MRPKLAERAEARRLREVDGMPLKRIARRLGVSVNSVHRWTHDIELTPEQHKRNLRGPRGPHSPEHIAARVEAWKRKSRDKRVGYQQEGRVRAGEGDAQHLGGCLLYWAEGSKSRYQVKFSNSDPAMVAYFRRFVTDVFGLSDEAFRVRLHVYLGNGLPIEEIENHWLDGLELPRACLRKHSINPLPTSSSGRKKNKLPYGVCTLSVCRSIRVVQHIYGAIQEYGGFEEPRWLD